MEKYKNLIDRFNKAGCSLDKLYSCWAKEYGLSYYGLILLCYVDENGLCTQKDICDSLSMTKTTVNSIVKNFVDSNVMDFRDSEHDKREKLLMITEEGESTYRDMLDRLYKAEINAMKAIEDNGAEKLIYLIESLSGNLKREMERSISDKKDIKGDR